jgi:DNA-binding MarR family transcriptional regulator
MKNAPPVDPTELIPGLFSRGYLHLFQHALHIVVDRLEAHFAQRDIDVRMMWVLMATEHKETSQKVIGQVLRINPNVMVNLIDRMEAKHLIRRERNPENRREHVLKLTPKGKELLKWNYATFDAVLKKVWRPLDVATLDHISTFARAIIKGHYADGED